MLVFLVHSPSSKSRIYVEQLRAGRRASKHSVQLLKARSENPPLGLFIYEYSSGRLASVNSGEDNVYYWVPPDSSKKHLQNAANLASEQRSKLVSEPGVNVAAFSIPAGANRYPQFVTRHSAVVFKDGGPLGFHVITLDNGLNLEQKAGIGPTHAFVPCTEEKAAETAEFIARHSHNFAYRQRINPQKSQIKFRIVGASRELLAAAHAEAEALVRKAMRAKDTP